MCVLTEKDQESSSLSESVSLGVVSALGALSSKTKKQCYLYM